MQPDNRQLRSVVILALSILLFGAACLAVSEHISLGEALYRAVYITLSHHDNFHMDSMLARITVLTLIIMSLLLLAYLLKVLVDYMIGLGDGLKHRQMKAKIAKLNNHYIICGLGRVGIQVADELTIEEMPFVAIDQDEEKVRDAINRGYVAVVGDCTKEEVLTALGVERASGLVASLGNDSANLLVTLAARQMNPKAYIVSRANRSENQQRMLRAGADQVALPYQIGGYHMANMVIRPNVVDFLEVLSNTNHRNLQIIELVVPDGSSLAGQRLEWLVHNHIAATVLAINTIDGTSKVHPSGTETIYAGDKLIMMGTHDQLLHASQRI